MCGTRAVGRGTFSSPRKADLQSPHVGPAPSPRADEAAGLLGRIVRAAWEEQRLSLRELGARTGIADAHLSQIETGVIARSLPGLILKLAAGLGVDAQPLLSCTHPEVGELLERLGRVEAELAQALLERDRAWIILRVLPRNMSAGLRFKEALASAESVASYDLEQREP
jgi:transcriptional regulator with XRE-family HTH domain